MGNRYSLRDYAEAAIAVATQKNISVIDLNQMSLDLYNQMLANGEDITTLGPAGDNTHLNETGAKVIADLTAFLQSDKNGLVTLIITRENTSSGTQEKFASKETTILADDGGSGSLGCFTPRLRIELQYPPEGTLLILQ